jgi:hypothetical protein
MAMTTESSVFWIVTPCSSETTYVSDKYITLAGLSLPPAPAGFLFSLVFKPEDGGNTPYSLNTTWCYNPKDCTHQV